MKTATAQSSLFPQWTMKLVVCSFEGVQMKSSFELCLILNALIVYSVQKTYQSNMQNKKFQREKKPNRFLCDANSPIRIMAIFMIKQLHGKSAKHPLKSSRSTKRSSLKRTAYLIIRCNQSSLPSLNQLMNRNVFTHQQDTNSLMGLNLATDVV